MRKPVEWLVNEYQKNLFAASYAICGNAEDARDAVQDTFIRYYTSKKEFKDEQHIRAWLLRVAVNRAKDMNRSFWRRNKYGEYIEELKNTPVFENEEESDLFDAVMKLPEKYRMVIHLFYYEDMEIKEISKVLGISEANVKIRLSRGRKMLKDRLKEEWLDD